MNDSLGPRLKVGILVPSTNTSAQPETDSMRPYGVSNHISRMVIQDESMVEHPGFKHVLHSIRAATEPALKSVMTCKPDHLIIGVSPESYWDSPSSHIDVLSSLQKMAGNIPVTMSPEAINAALKAYGHIHRIAVITPYLPLGDNTVSKFFTDSGYDVIAIQGLGCHSPSMISHVSESQIKDAIKKVDKPDVEAIIQVGTNVAMAHLAAIAEVWIDKPVLSNNAVLYWYALRSSGILDRINGFGSLFTMH